MTSNFRLTPAEARAYRDQGFFAREAVYSSGELEALLA